MLRMVNDLTWSSKMSNTTTLEKATFFFLANWKKPLNTPSPTPIRNKNCPKLLSNHDILLVPKMKEKKIVWRSKSIANRIKGNGPKTMVLKCG